MNDEHCSGKVYHRPPTSPPSPLISDTLVGPPGPACPAGHQGVQGPQGPAGILAPSSIDEVLEAERRYKEALEALKRVRRSTIQSNTTLRDAKQKQAHSIENWRSVQHEIKANLLQAINKAKSKGVDVTDYESEALTGRRRENHPGRI